MGEMVRIAQRLREVERFRGYIHLKTIPDAAPELIEQAGRYADRLSINIELPTDESVRRFAPGKDPATIRKTMAGVRLRREAAADTTHTGRKASRFAPAGQSTQVIVGADGATDATILRSSARLYGGYRLKRVYYSAFSPIPDASAKLPLVRPPLEREHRLYQADWLMRFYGFEVDEIAGAAEAGGGNLDLGIDPKLAWALANRGRFPVDVNTADRAMLLRVPGLGVKSVERILAARRERRLGLAELKRLGGGLKKARAFVVAADWSPGRLTDSEGLRARFAPPPEQLSLF
jgi:putative DNA modification/repair radical SAM protein